MVTPIPTMPVKVSRIQHRRGTQAEFNALYPPGYTGRGGVAGNDVLQAGEMALCTDTRRVFMGLPNGEYTELALKTGVYAGSTALTPIHIELPNTAVFTPISQLSYKVISYKRATLS